MSKCATSRQAALLRDQTAAPGLALGRLEGRALSIALAGRRRADAGEAVELHDRWHLGSLGKAMVCLVVARLALRGLCGPDMTLGDVYGAASGEFSRVTLADVMTHRSGMTANFGMGRMIWESSPGFGETERSQRARLARRVMAGTPLSAPGARFLYSNLGYLVLGAALEQLADLDFAALLAREVLGPLGLHSAGFGAPPDNFGHRGARGAERPVGGAKADNPPFLTPAGRLHLSAPDLMTYLAAHARQEPRLLPAAQWAWLHSAPYPDYGFGWGLLPDGSLGHAGSNTLWFAKVRLWPAQGRAAALLCNSGRIDEIDAMATAWLAA